MNIQSIGYAVGGVERPGLLVSKPSTSLPRPGVLVLHGGAGPGEHERERAQRLAELGYSAYVPDLFGERFESRAHGMAVITELTERPTCLRERVLSAHECLRGQPGVDASRTAVIGFCFGGLAALELARAGAAVSAVVSFHGGLQTRAPARAGDVAGRVLVCTGSADPFVPAEQRAALEAEMTHAKVDWQMSIYGGALHGFTERGVTSPRPGCAYDAAADARSWRAMRVLLEEAFGEPPT